jgi:hypothetical protein
MFFILYKYHLHRLSISFFFLLFSSLAKTFRAYDAQRELVTLLLFANLKSLEKYQYCISLYIAIPIATYCLICNSTLFPDRDVFA